MSDPVSKLRECQSKRYNRWRFLGLKTQRFMKPNQLKAQKVVVDYARVFTVPALIEAAFFTALLLRDQRNVASSQHRRDKDK